MNGEKKAVPTATPNGNEERAHGALVIKFTHAFNAMLCAGIAAVTVKWGFPLLASIAGAMCAASVCMTLVPYTGKAVKA